MPAAHVARRRPALGALAAAALSVALVACGSSKAPANSTAGGAAGSPAPGSRVTLRLGYFPNITHATAIVGVEQGIFAQALGPNVKLETSTFNAGPAAVEALFSHALDAAYMGPNPALNAYVQSKGEAVRVISGATSGGAYLVVRPDVNGAADLRGKKVASPQLGNTQDVALRNWLSSQGLKTDPQGGGDVSVVPQDNADTLNAFKSGQIAGAWVPEPWATRMVREGGGKVLVDERSLWPGGQYVTTLLVVRTDYQKRHPDVIERLLQGQIAANRLVNSQPDAARRTVNSTIQRLTGQSLSAETIAAAWPNLSFTNDPLLPTLRKSAEAASALGFLKLGSLSLDNIADVGLLNQALNAAGLPQVASQ
ncbi:MAG TPA: ABC transporter substrate-binding protein [Dehalococcoidia bacterium]|nr:ABC transporter substrate-binding protein [Dehalococcoidia bacterium]